MNGTVISCVKHAEDTATRDIKIETVLEAIRTGGKKLNGQITQIRNRFEAELAFTGGEGKKAKAAVTTLKMQLPAITPSGRFKERKAEALLEYFGVVQADLDLLGDKLPAVHKLLEASPYVWVVFLSPTGDGLKVWFRAPVDASLHARSFRAVEKYVRDLCGVQIDVKCKDIARLCFMSFDPNLYVNWDAIEIEPLPEPEKPKPVHIDGDLPPDLSLRERIATLRLGELKYSAEKGGYFCKCPGEANHTNTTGEKHTIVYLEGAPTLDCQHESCKGIVDAFNAQLRSEIGKAEWEAKHKTTPHAKVQEAPKWGTRNLCQRTCLLCRPSILSVCLRHYGLPWKIFRSECSVLPSSRQSV
jgi:hypothetical protein